MNGWVKLMKYLYFIKEIYYKFVLYTLIISKYFPFTKEAVMSLLLTAE